MKRALALLLLCNFQTAFAGNSILALVNDKIITYSSIEKQLTLVESYEEKLAVINFRINTILQLKKAQEFDIYPLQSDVDQTILELANINNIPLEELSSRSDFNFITQEINEKLSLLNLQRFVTKDLKFNLSNDELINKCPITNEDNKIKQIKIAQIIISSVNLNESIKAFLQKLSAHILKGASFESLAKLHSQHPSYANGGVSEWITVNNPTIQMLDLLEYGEVSDIYTTKMGFAIAIKIDERLVSDNLKNCKNKLIYLNAEKFYSNWIKELRSKAYIKIYHDKI